MNPLENRVDFCPFSEGAWTLRVKAGQWAGKEHAGLLEAGSTEFES